MKLSQAIEGFLLFKHNLSPNTIDAYRVALQHLRNYLPDDPDINTITADDINAFMAHLRLKTLHFPNLQVQLEQTFLEEF